MHQVRAVSLTGYAEVAAFVGLDGQRMLREAGLSPAMLRDPENRIPAAAAIGLLERSAERSGCDQFGLLLAEARTFASLGPVSLLLERLPDVRAVIEAATTFQRHLNDVVSVGLEEAGGTSLIRVDIEPGYPGVQMRDYSLGMAYRVLTGASGNRWRPEAVHLNRDAPADLSIARRLFAAPLEFGASFNGLSCPTEDLAIPNPLADEAMARHALHLLQLVKPAGDAGSPGDSVRRVITLLLPSGRATLENAAAQLAVSPRSLQRRLNAEGRSFADLLEEVRRELASSYLTGSTRPVTAVATMLGYGSVSSFSRWFAGAFGMSPRAWRSRQSRPRPEGPPPLWRR